MSDDPIEILERPRLAGLATSPALLHGDLALTYADLQKAVTPFAADLTSRGVASGDRIMLAMRKSIPHVVAVLAALKLGVTYSSVDPELPDERLEYMVGNARARLIVADGGYFPQGDMAGVPLAVASWSDGQVRLSSTPQLPRPLSLDQAENPAYIIYTSGSTGQPKGVMIPRRALEAFLDAARGLGLYDSTTRFLSVSPLHFDASVLDVFAPLQAGGAVVLLDRLRWPREVLNAVRRFEVTDTLLVPSIMNLLLAHGEAALAEHLGSLRSLWFGGEASSVETVRRFMQVLPKTRFVHGYGPTECTHSTSVNVMTSPPPMGSTGLSMGTILPGMTAYVVDPQGERVPPGETGELWIAGPQLMIGYCGDPESTGRALIPNPFDPGLVYRSGDLVTQDADGHLNFVSRLDDMVKIHGNLVYLSEIEGGLYALRGIRQAVAFRSDTETGGRLVAGIVVDEDAPGDADVRRAIAARLPRYMVPDVIVRLGPDEAFVRGTGKIDRDRLVEHVQRRLGER